MIADASTAARAAGVSAALGFLLVAGFQVALALGAPLGRAAWGGIHDRLPSGLRIASAFAAVFWTGAGLVILILAGYEPVPIPLTVPAWVAWALFGLLALGALMNLASKSKWERFLMSPVSLVLSLCCLVVALDL